MDGAGNARRVRIYVNEADSCDGQPTYGAILRFLRREHCAGATVVRGIMGFTHGRIATANLVDLASALPVIIEWIDRPERVERLLPRLGQMTPDGLITVEAVQVFKYPRRALQDLPTDILVRDLMTPAARVVSTPLNASVPDLVVLLLQHRRHAIPVLDRDRRVRGIITNRDLTERAGLPLRLELLRALGDPDGPAVAPHLAGLRGDGRTAASIMTPDPVTTGPDVPVATVAKLLLQHRLKRLPVVDSDGHLIGMVSRFDLLKTAANTTIQHDSAMPSAASHGYQPPRQLGEAMNRYVPTVAPDTPLPEVLDAVMMTRLHRAVVVDGAGRPVGIVVDTDLLPRITPQARPGVMRRLMQRMRPGTPEEREAWQHLTGERAQDVMRPRDKMLILPVDTPLATAVDQALPRKIKLIVVVDAGGQVVGMADRADLLASLVAAR